MPNKATIRQDRYDATHTTQLNLKLNLKTDEDILRKLASVPSKQGYIKYLIRKDINRKTPSK